MEPQSIVPSERWGRSHVAEEFADQGLTVDDLCSQIAARIELEDLARGPRPLTPRRMVRAVFDISRARRRNGLRPYPESVVHAVTWMMLRDR